MVGALRQAPTPEISWRCRRRLRLQDRASRDHVLHDASGQQRLEIRIERIGVEHGEVSRVFPR
jgi:hypothetical protein